MTRTIKVDVTQEDIQNGVRASCEHCPVALAVRRAVGESEYILVSPSQIIVGFADNTVWELDTPDVVAHFIWTFDGCGRSDAAPLAFTLEVPDDAQAA